MSPLFKKTTKLFLQQTWRLIFKLIILPAYKIYLKTYKKINQYLIHNPYLTKQQKEKLLWLNSITHIIIIVISTLVVFFNISTRDTYAEEFNKNSVFAQLFATEENSEEIIEKAPNYTQLNKYTKTQTILNQLAALKAKSNLNQASSLNKTELMAISPSGDAIIKPQTTPFESSSSETTTASASTPSRQGIQTYVVKKGDTISTIAKKFGLSINTILWENKLSLNSYIRPGDKLTILPVDGITYTIRSGDTISSIAKRYGSTVNKILAYNNLTSANKIRVNQKIIIPDGKLGHTPLTPTKTIRSYKKPTNPNSRFVWPSVSKRITQYYHWRHHAIDIGAKLGSPIYAIQGGRVERAGWSRGYGYNIVINHGNGIKSLYAHASKLYVKRGQQVKQGQIIGAVGSTGWSTGPHIHLEIRINNKKVNPLSYF